MRAVRSSSSSRTVAPDASTSRAPPASARSTGGTLTRLMRRRLGGDDESSTAELDVVDVLSDARIVAADRAVRAALDLHLVELRRERVEEQQPADERVADPGRKLDRLVRLQRADDARQHPQHAALGARRRELWRRRLREEAAVAGAFVRMEDG